MNSCHNKEFALVAEESSQQWYRTLWKRFLSFVLRVCRMDKRLQRETNLTARVRTLNFLESIWQHRVWDFVDTLEGVWPNLAVYGEMTADEAIDQGNLAYWGTDETLQTGQGNDSTDHDVAEADSDDDGAFTDEDAYSDNGELDDEGCDDSGYASDGHDRDCPGVRLRTVLTEDSETAMSAYTEFLELLFQFNVTLITEPFIDGLPDSTLLFRFSGILGFSSDGRRFLLAREYCPRLSPLIYIQRLLFLELALPIQPYKAAGISSRPREDQLKRLNEIRGTYMITGSQSPFAELVSLRDAGRNICRTEPPAFILRWSDDDSTVHFGPERSLSMESFRMLADHFITRAEKLCAKLMLGVEQEVDLPRMRDDMTKSDYGYSFIKDPHNELDRPYQELLARACISPSAGLSRHGQWSWAGVTAYLRDAEKLEEMLAGALYTACGQVPRLRELLSLEHENGPLSKGSMSLWNGSVIYVIRHHKAKRQTNREFYVARFLPARLGVIMCRYLACIRRLSDMLRRERYGHLYRNHPPTQSRLLFHSNNDAWKPSRLTSILKRATLELWGFPVNARLYRQIAIGITEKHVREVHLPFNRHDDTSSRADLNVAFPWQGGHRPLQRGITYGLDGAFPHQLQPALLRAYEWASTRWHEFIKQPSKALPPQDPLILTSEQPQEKRDKRRFIPFIEEVDSFISDSCSIKRRKLAGTRLFDTQQVQAATTEPSLATPDGTSSLALSSVISPGSQPTPKAGGRLRLDNLVCILHEHNILICLICQAAIRPGEAIERHFRKSHGAKKDTLRRILSFCRGWSFEDPRNVILPRDKTPPIPELKKLPGYNCKECGFKTINRTGMLCHFSKSPHISPKSEEPRWTMETLQTFCGSGYARYWIVSE